MVEGKEDETNLYSTKGKKRKQKDLHQIIITIDANETFISAKEGIAKLCRQYWLFDLLNQQHGNSANIGTHIRGKERIDFIFCTLDIVQACSNSGITGYGEVTATDYRGLFIEFRREILLQNLIIDIPPPNNRILKLSWPRYIRAYK